MDLGTYCLLTFAITSVVSEALFPDVYSYFPLTAKRKQELQWKQIVATQYSFDYLPTSFPLPNENVSNLANSTFLTATFTTYGDEFPYRRILNSPFGSVCMVNFNTFKNSTSQFTGLWETGGIGIVRYSLNGLRGNLDNFAPTVMFKIYIDGSWSQNIPAVKDPIIGQGADKNFFRDTVSNIFNISLSQLAPEPIYLAFVGTVALLPGDALARPLDNANMGMYEQAGVRSDGTNVTRIIAPWQVLFVPNPAIAIHPALFDRDLRQNIYDVIQVGTLMYTVYGLRTNVSSPELIGEVYATSACLPSSYGDNILFFRHPSLRWRL